MVDSNSDNQEFTQGHFSGLAGLWGALLVLLTLTWRRLPDPVVDFGRELYVPWRLSVGDVLYTDIAYFNGPLSPYFHAVLFQCFGTGLTTLMISNVVLLFLLTSILYWLLVQISSVRTAIIAGVTFLIVFAFSHALRIGNYNYICPYSHEMTHGITLIFVMLGLSRTRYWQFRLGQLLMGVLWGLVFLGKAELFLASSGMLVAIIGMDSLHYPGKFREATTRFVLSLAGASVPILGFLFFLWQNMPWEDAVSGIAGTWYWIANSSVSDGEFYRRMSGLDRPWENLAQMFRSAVVITAAVLLAKSFELWRIEKRKPWLFAAAASLATIAYLNGGLFPILLQGTALPLIAIAISLIAILSRIFRTSPLLLRMARQNNTSPKRKRGITLTERNVPDCKRGIAPNEYTSPKRKRGISTKSNETSKLELIIAWSILAGLLMLKFPFRATIVHYGFVLAMPIVLLGIAWSFENLPKLLCRRTGGATAYAALCFMLLADVFGSGAMTASNILAKKNALGHSHDKLWVDSERGGQHVAEVIDWIKENTDEDDAILVLPEGVMVNYQTRRRSPVAYVNLCPPEVDMYGESNILADFIASPANYIVLINKDVREYGVAHFGAEEYGKQLVDWIQDNYQTEKVFASKLGEPFLPSVTMFHR